MFKLLLDMGEKKMKYKDALEGTINDKAVKQPQKKAMLSKLKCPKCGYVAKENESKDPMDALS